MRSQSGFSVIEMIVTALMVTGITLSVGAIYIEILRYNRAFEKESELRMLRNYVLIKVSCAETKRSVEDGEQQCNGGGNNLELRGKNNEPVIHANSGQTRIGDYRLRTRCDRDTGRTWIEYNASDGNEGWKPLYDNSSGGSAWTCVVPTTTGGRGN